MLTGLTAALVVLSLSLIFFYAPVERRMGIVQKIFYFHVPSAYAMYLAFSVGAFGSIRYLGNRDPKWDALGVAGVETAMAFFTIVLTTGPLWARKAWGVYWTWDPRLTTTLLAGMIGLAYLALRSFGEAGETEKRFASGLSVIAIPVLPLIHYSVKRWRGVHPTVITSSGGGLHPDMYPALGAGFALFTCLVGVLVWLRYRAERNHERALELTLRSLEREAAEEA